MSDEAVDDAYVIALGHSDSPNGTSGLTPRPSERTSLVMLKSLLSLPHPLPLGDTRAERRSARSMRRDPPRFEVGK